jgi:hypothetical protein
MVEAMTDTTPADADAAFDAWDIRHREAARLDIWRAALSHARAASQPAQEPAIYPGSPDPDLSKLVPNDGKWYLVQVTAAWQSDCFLISHISGGPIEDLKKSHPATQQAEPVAFEKVWEYEWAQYGKPTSLSATAAKTIAYACLNASHPAVQQVEPTKETVLNSLSSIDPVLHGCVQRALYSLGLKEGVPYAMMSIPMSKDEIAEVLVKLCAVANAAPPADDEAVRLLREARLLIARAGAAKLSDGTYFDKNCACTMLYAAIDAYLARVKK